MNEQELFIAALRIDDAANRAGLLDRECGDDRAKRERVEVLLKAHAEAGSFLEEPGTRAFIGESDSNAEIGAVIGGKYKLLERIGEGGMGSVWMAQQSEPVKRKVAVKLIKRGMDSRQVLARFEAERQALAVMDHPNIAKILDGGVAENGSPYFVMELVKGVPITKYCDAHKLTPRQRLELFVPVCQAIQHAHQKGIIHRDIKPSNVMVALYDDRPVPKVIDFGVAKATGQSLTEKTFHTGFGGIIGTPEYMSPEQASLNNLDIDTRSDIYSLGVLLYELLAGSPPFKHMDLEKAGMLEMLRVIREDEPPRPSTKLSTADALPGLSANRGTEPTKLTGILRNELDWIVMRALEKDRARRYATANGFAADINRFLAGEAVIAHPPSAGYRLRKFVRKNRAMVTAAAAVLFAVSAGSGIATWQAVRAKHAESDARIAQREATADRDKALKAEAESKVQRDSAVAEKRRGDDEAAVAKAVNDFLVNDLLQPAARGAFALAGRTPPNPNLRASDLIDRAAERLGDRFKDQPRIEADLREVLAGAYGGLRQNERSILQWEKGAELRASTLGPNHPTTLFSRLVLSEQLHRAGRKAEAIRIWDEIQAILTANGRSIAREHFPTVGRLAMGFHMAGRLPQSIALYEQLRDAGAAADGPDHLATLNTVLDLAWAYRAAGRPADFERLLEHVRSVVFRPERQNDPDLPHILGRLADRYRDADRPAEAIPVFKRELELLTAKYGLMSGRVIALSVNLAYAYLEAGLPNDAIPIFEELRDRTTKSAGPFSTVTLDRQFVLSLAYRHAGRPADAIPLLKQLRDVYATAGGDSASDELHMTRHLAEAYKEAGRLPEALAEYEALAPKFKAKWGAESEFARQLWSKWGHALEEDRQFGRAAAVITELLAIERKVFPADHPDIVLGLLHIGSDLISDARPAEAEPFLRECLAIREQKEPDVWTTFNTKSLLGGSLLGQKKYIDAEPLLLAGYEGMKQRQNQPPKGSEIRITQALERLTNFYTAWHAAEPGKGYDTKAAEWKLKHEKSKK